MSDKLSMCGMCFPQSASDQQITAFDKKNIGNLFYILTTNDSLKSLQHIKITKGTNLPVTEKITVTHVRKPVVGVNPADFWKFTGENRVETDRIGEILNKYFSVT